MNAASMLASVHVPLARMALCLDCEACFEIGSGPCPACGSHAWASVARFLTRRLER